MTKTGVSFYHQTGTFSQMVKDDVIFKGHVSIRKKRPELLSIHRPAARELRHLQPQLLSSRSSRCFATKGREELMFPLTLAWVSCHSPTKAGRVNCCLQVCVCLSVTVLLLCNGLAKSWCVLRIALLLF